MAQTLKHSSNQNRSLKVHNFIEHHHHQRISEIHREMHQSVTSALVIVTIILLIGTIFFHYVENFSWINSFYFSGITMTTLGYGDYVPTKDSSKVFVVFYSLFSLGLILYSASIIASKIVEKLTVRSFIKRLENKRNFKNREITYKVYPS